MMGLSLRRGFSRRSTFHLRLAKPQLHLAKLFLYLSKLFHFIVATSRRHCLPLIVVIAVSTWARGAGAGASRGSTCCFGSLWTHSRPVIL